VVDLSELLARSLTRTEAQMVVTLMATIRVNVTLCPDGRRYQVALSGRNRILA
jgi:hypothetical protein